MSFVLHPVGWQGIFFCGCLVWQWHGVVGVLFDHIWRCLLKLPGAGNDWNADLTL